MSARKIFIVAGEASGDVHASHLLKELLKSYPDIELYATGGKALASLKPKWFYDLAKIHVTGFTEVLSKIPVYLRAFSIIKEKIDQVRPDLILFVDNPGFNLKLLKKIASIPAKKIYYISPQLWAWNPGRIHILKRYIDQMLVIFPFEQKLFTDHQISSVYVGHPLLDSLSCQINNEDIACVKRPVIALLPGSRKNEIERNAPELFGAVANFKQRYPEVIFRLYVAPTIDERLLNQSLAMCKNFLNDIQICRYPVSQDLHECQAAVVCSGTASLECAIAGVPMLIFYRTSWLSYIIGRIVIKIPHLGLPNILLGRKAFTELLQGRMTATNIVEHLEKILFDPKTRQQALEDLSKIHLLLGKNGASEKAAEEIKKFL